MCVRPSALSAAMSTADFTCALATGISKSIARSARPPRIWIGGRPLFVVMSAFISRKGAAMRSMGRRISEASPMSVESKRWPASSPASMRIAAPLLPRSSGRVGRLQPFRTDAADDQPIARATIVLTSDVHAQLAYRGERCECVCAFEETAHRRLAVRDAPEHQQPMRDRFVAGHANVSSDEAGPLARRMQLPAGRRSAAIVTRRRGPTGRRCHRAP